MDSTARAVSHILTAKERQALEAMGLNSASFHIKAELGTGIGTKTIESLLALGLTEGGAKQAPLR
jgi:hypothetical protein